MTLPKIYVKKGEEVIVNSRFVYRVTIYKIWNLGFSLLSDRTYTCSNPFNFKNLANTLKTKTHSIQRSITLEGAPESYLTKHGYKLKTE